MWIAAGPVAAPPTLPVITMLEAANRLLSARPRFQLGAFSFFLIGVVGAIDFATGFEVSFSIFYVIPVAIASWYAGRRLGLLICFISAVTWVAVDYASGHQYSYATIPFWNACVRLGFFVIIAILLIRLRHALDAWELLAQQDGLTGMMNARTFGHRCSALFDLASRHGHPMALGYLDLDGFKSVNDSLGHSVGDQVLKAVAVVLMQRLRASDCGGRLGADEFAILLPETDLAGAKAFFTALRSKLLDLAARNCWPVGFSIGVAVFRSPPANPEDAIRHADSLMYRVKSSGKNNIMFEEYPAVSPIRRADG